MSLSRSIALPKYVPNDAVYHEFLKSAKRNEDMLATPPPEFVLHENLTGSMNEALKAKKADKEAEKAAQIKQRRDERRQQDANWWSKEFHDKDLYKYQKKPFDALLNWFQELGLSRSLDKDGPGKQAILKAVLTADIKTSQPRSLEKRFTPHSVADAITTGYHLHHFVQCVVPDDEMQRRRNAAMRLSELVTRTVTGATIFGSRQEAVAGKFPGLARRMTVPYSRSGEHFFAYRFYFFDLDFPLNTVSREQLLDYLEYIKIKPYVRSIIETAPGRYHIYVASQHIIGENVNNTMWKVESQEVESEEWCVWVQKVCTALKMDVEYLYEEDAIRINQQFLQAAADQAKLLESEGLGNAFEVKRRLESRRDYIQHFLPTCQDIRGHRPGTNFIDSPKMAREYQAVWQRLNCLLNGDPCANTTMREAAVPFYSKMSRSLGRETTPQPIYTNADAPILTVSQARRILGASGKFNSIASTLNIQLKETPQKVTEKTSMPKKKSVEEVRDTEHLAALRRDIRTTLSAAPLDLAVSDVLLANTDLMERIWNRVDWVGQAGYKPNQNQTTIGMPRSVIDYFRSTRKWGAYEHGKTDYYGERNQLVLDLARYAHIHINIYADDQVETYWNSFCLPFLSKCRSKDLDRGPRGIEESKRSFLACIRGTIAALASGRLLSPGASLSTRPASEGDRENTFKRLMDKLSPYNSRVQCANISLFIAAMANVASLHNPLVTNSVWQAFVPTAALTAAVGGRVQDNIERLENLRILKRSTVYHFPEVPDAPDHKKKYSPKTRSLPGGGQYAPNRGRARAWVLFADDSYYDAISADVVFHQQLERDCAVALRADEQQRVVLECAAQRAESSTFITDLKRRIWGTQQLGARLPQGMTMMSLASLPQDRMIAVYRSILEGLTPETLDTADRDAQWIEDNRNTLRFTIDGRQVVPEPGPQPQDRGESKQNTSTLSIPSLAQELRFSKTFLQIRAGRGLQRADACNSGNPEHCATSESDISHVSFHSQGPPGTRTLH